MTANEEVMIQDTVTLKTFIFRCVSSFKPKKSQPATTVNLVQTPPASTVLFRFTGQLEEVAFTFAIFNDGVDVSDGTNPTPIITVAQQIQYLKDVIYTYEFDRTWALWDSTGLVYPIGDAIVGVIEDVDFDLVKGSQSIVTGHLIFKRGMLGDL